MDNDAGFVLSPSRPLIVTLYYQAIISGLPCEVTACVQMPGRSRFGDNMVKTAGLYLQLMK